MTPGARKMAPNWVTARSTMPRPARTSLTASSLPSPFWTQRMTVRSNGAMCQVEEKFLIAGRAGDRRRCHAGAGEPGGERRVGDAREHRVVHRGIGHQSVLADLLAARLELRLDERDDVGG